MSDNHEVTVWIDRLRRTALNAWSRRETPYFDYFVHVTKDDALPTLDNRVHVIDGDIDSAREWLTLASQYADTLANALGAPVKRTWEEGHTNFQIIFSGSLRSPDEASAREWFTNHKAELQLLFPDVRLVRVVES